MTPMTMLRGAIRSRWTCADRSRIADYGKSDLEKLRAAMKKSAMEVLERKPPDPETWLKEAMAFDALARKIQARGGRVVFLRLPTRDELWQSQETRNPKRLYWDRLAEKASATMIHFRDVDSLKDFPCPDMSHLDYQDACRFTKALVQELRKRGVIPEPAGDGEAF